MKKPVPPVFIIDDKPEIKTGRIPKAAQELIDICNSIEYPRLISLRRLSELSGLSVGTCYRHSTYYLKENRVMGRKSAFLYGNKKTVKDYIAFSAATAAGGDHHSKSPQRAS